MRSAHKILGSIGVAALFAACAASGPLQEGGSGNTGGASAAATTTGAGGDIGFGGAPGGTGNGNDGCDATPNEDRDHDGFTIAQGDCNDCDPNVNPGAVEVIATPGDGGVPAPVDEDCNGKIDDVEQPCDQALNVADTDPMNAAKAVELCRVAKGPKDWGVVSAKWTMADGAPPPADPALLDAFHLGHGLLDAFGPNVNTQAGKRMLALSSGTARQPTDPGFQSPGAPAKGYGGGQPQGFPKESPACPGIKTGDVFDPVGLELAIRVPTNAHGFSFRFDFYTVEWPAYICSTYNDFFVALLSPIPKGQMDGNISFDKLGNPISVNNALLDVCGCYAGPPCMTGGKTFACSQGDSALIGNGFKDDFQIDHAATGWLYTKAPADPGQEITLRWTVYDSSDGLLESTTLIDAWQWIAEPGTEVGTGVVEPPK